MGAAAMSEPVENLHVVEGENLFEKFPDPLISLDTDFNFYVAKVDETEGRVPLPLAIEFFAENLNASDIASGTLADARLSSTVTKQGNSFNGASQLVQMTAATKLPAVDGSLLTSMTKSQVGLSNVDNTSDANKPVSTAQQTALDLKANLASPAFSGNPTVPNQAANDNSTKAANTAYADAKVADAINDGTTTIAPSQNAVFDALALKINSTEKAAANGVATLDMNSKLTTSQLPDSVVGALNYQGTWNANTNSPTLTSGVGTKGYLYIVDTAGTTNLDGITDWQIQDFAIFSGTVWQKIDTTDLVVSVNSQTGVVVITKSDVGLSNVENTALSTWAGSSNITTLGLIASGEWNGTLLGLAYGGLNKNLSADSGIVTVSGGVTTVLTPPAGSLVGTTEPQTLTNKTLTSPVINTPTGLTKSDVGLNNVDNTSDATKNAAAVTLTNKTLTSPIINTPTGIVKGDVGLGNVDNTSDANKPVSTATQAAIDALDTPDTFAIVTISGTTPTVRRETNLDSFVRNNVGDYTWNFDVDYANTNYGWLPGYGTTTPAGVELVSKNVGSLNLKFGVNGVGYFECSTLTLAVYA